MVIEIIYSQRIISYYILIREFTLSQINYIPTVRNVKIITKIKLIFVIYMYIYRVEKITSNILLCHSFNFKFLIIPKKITFYNY